LYVTHTWIPKEFGNCFRTEFTIPMGLLAAWRWALRLWLCRSYEPWCNLLHGILYAASLHDATGSHFNPSSKVW